LFQAKDEIMNPSFSVRPEYFYALTAHLPTTISSDQRYRLITLQPEEQLAEQLSLAIDAGIIDGGLAPNHFQAARRLSALGRANDPAPECVGGGAGTPVHDLVQAWLDVAVETTETFWGNVEVNHTEGHLDLVLCALTDSHDDLSDAIKTVSNPAPPANPLDAFTPIASVAELADRTDRQWRAFFWRIQELINSGAMPGLTGIEDVLPEFTKPGTVEERIEAFIRHLRKFLAVGAEGADDPVLDPDAPPMLGVSQFDIFRQFADAYQTRAGVAFAFGAAFNEVDFMGAIGDVVPQDEQARAWLEEALRAIHTLHILANVGAPPGPNEPDLRFSIMEALYARGFTSAEDVAALSLEQFTYALTGSVAYHYAADIYANAGGSGGDGAPSPEPGFQAINPDGRLVNCIPPEHLSPFGPFAYLRDLLHVSASSTCDDPLPDLEGSENQATLGAAIAGRRGDVGNLAVTRANLDTPLPMIDLVNESLEFLAANLPGTTSGAIYDTAMSDLDTHKLRPPESPDKGHDPYRHDAAKLLEALPEHSSPATPVEMANAYDRLEDDFTDPDLPYAQGLDVERTYLRHLGTTRYAVMRRFREDITTFVLAPDKEPADFQRHLWRYPVRCEIAIEYLGINPEEYDLLFAQDIVKAPAGDSLVLHELYGFPDETVGDKSWLDVVVRLPEFLARTGLDYCEFRELWLSQFVAFSRAPAQRTTGDDVEIDDIGGDGSGEGGNGDGDDESRAFPECDPCCLDDYVIQFETPADAQTALARLAVFIRLWRKLQQADPALYRFDDLWQNPYTFAQLKDICDVLGLFQGDSINPDYVCQLAAMQILRDHFAMSLTDATDTPPGATGSDRTHLLALWEGPGAAKWEWARDHLIEKIQHYAQKRLEADDRAPEFIKILAENLNPLSRLIGFNPGKATHTWHANPRHTLRFAEVLAKIYASDFGIGEILFLFTAEDHLDGDDPFELQTDEEMSDSPLDFPDDEPNHALWALRDKLLAVDVTDEEAEAWTWADIETALRDEFGYTAPGPTDPLRSLGEHFFPEMLEESGFTIVPAARQYRVSLVTPSPAMWNTSPRGPFRYDPGAAELWTELPLIDEEVLIKISRVRQLDAAEQDAVRELYFLPRVDLAHVGFIFSDFAEAQRRLIQEPDEAQRWSYFRREYACFYKCCQVIAQHLTEHVIDKTGQLPTEEGYDLAWLILRHLYADENRAMANWENNNGTMPSLTWGAQPRGGAFVALLDLRGTGLLGEFRAKDGTLLWRELRGGADAFSAILNDWNAPAPTVIPAMNLTLNQEQANFVGIHNGFAFSAATNERLGGMQGWRVMWQGSMLVEQDGTYQFVAGAPTEEGETPDFEAAHHNRWRVTLKRGQKTWILLNHRWVGEDAPAADETSLALRRGVYQLMIEFEQPAPEFERIEDVCPQVTGFQLKYAGPDTDDETVTIPLKRLFYEKKDAPLDDQISDLQGTAQASLREHYVSTIRDMRRTYERSYKALLFAHRMGLSAKKRADSGQSELGYMLAHADDFAGASYFQPNVNFSSHKAQFNFNFLPLDDIYDPPSAGQDRRAAPTVKRQQALFDWWERLVDYVDMRAHTQMSPENPVWLLFHEAAEAHEDNPAHLLRHMGVDHSHADRVLKYYMDYNVTSSDLEDERWAIRAWRAEMWIDALMAAFYCQNNDIRPSRPDLWAGDDPLALEAGEAETANQNLTLFVRRGLIENGDLRRYDEVKLLNDQLRLRARVALFAYLCGMDRVPLPWGVHVESPKDLSDLLLLDVEVGICEKASRIEEAISATQLLVQRARLGLELGAVPPDFALAWDRHFATLRIWEACKRRHIYRENWIEWDELEKAQGTEAFQYLEDQLRRSTLTVPIPGGLEYWDGPNLPPHPSLTLLQSREPAVIERLTPPPDESGSRYGLGIVGTPDRHARPSWLAPLPGVEGREPEPDDENGHDGDDDNGQPPDPVPVPAQPDDSPTVLFALAGSPEMMLDITGELPFWIEAAVRLGARFVRVAAAGIPPASARFEPHGEPFPRGCCPDCGHDHEPVMDEYYFWLVDGRYYQAMTQEADLQTLDWHNPWDQPTLLHWGSDPLVYVAWCRVHNGEFQPPRWSSEGVRVEGPADLKFLGRLVDSLYFEVENGIAPIGYPPQPAPGFRFDLATDDALVLPLINTSEDPPELPGELSVYPYFAHFLPGSPLMPPSRYSPALAVAAALRAHCRYEEALKWYDYVFAPLDEDLAWTWCPSPLPEPREPDESDEPDEPDEPDVPGVPIDDIDVDGDDRDDDDDDIILINADFEADGNGIPLLVGMQSACCQPTVGVSDDIARKRSVTLHSLETLIDWGDALMRLNTPEAFQKARVIFDAAARIVGRQPRTVVEHDETESDGAPSVEAFTPNYPALNPRLMSIYERVDDRLDLIHACLNAWRLNNGRPNVDMPYWGVTPLRDGWKNNAQICLDEDDWCSPASPYRFLFLVQKAQELAGEVRSLGASLLAAYEKGDAEYLAALRAGHERQLHTLTQSIRKNQWREADWQVQALQKSKEHAQERLRYYERLIALDLNAEELQYENWTGTSLGSRAAGNITEAIGQGLHLIPDLYVGFPCNQSHLPIGTKLSYVFSALARIAFTVADIASTNAGLDLTQGGWLRREDEWQHQTTIIPIEIDQIGRQILGAERRRDAALQELNNNQKQIEQAAEAQDFLREKFTSHALYLWDQKETAALHEKMFYLGLHTARQAERAFNYERGHTSQTFVKAEIWDDLHEGLLAGDRLQFALRQMEKAYLDANQREYELTKHISLRQHAPWAFMYLKATGYCEVELPEWLFDLDYPGQYMRRIKNVSLTLPCVVGPYSGVHCRLTLLSSSTRIDPRLRDPVAECCADDDNAFDNGYAHLAEDPRIVKQYVATEAIATSSGQNDAGLFELNFRDERYLPFEFAGAVSRWRLELPPENNYFDVDTLSDVILHLNYTAREGGQVLREAAREAAQERLPGDGWRLFDVEHDFPNEWHQFQGQLSRSAEQRGVGVQLTRSMFPYLPSNSDLRISRLFILFETEGAVPSKHQTLEFMVGQLHGDRHRCEIRNVVCAATSEWPRLFVGALDTIATRLPAGDKTIVGTLLFPEAVQSVSAISLLCRFEMVSAQSELQ
jgi:hypothetical protein